METAQESPAPVARGQAPGRDAEGRRRQRRTRPPSKSRGPKGTLTRELPPRVSVKKDGEELSSASRRTPASRARKFQGLARALVANMVQGVPRATSALELSAPAIAPRSRASELNLSLGFSHPVQVPAARGGQRQGRDHRRRRHQASALHLDSSDKELLGQAAAHIRSLPSTGALQGQGRSLPGENIREKAGKAGKRAQGQVVAPSTPTVARTQRIRTPWLAKQKGASAASVASARRSPATPSVRASACSAARSTSTRRSIDDTSGRTLATVSTLSQGPRRAVEGDKTDAAKKVGAAIAKRASGKGIEKVVFDRNGYLYHGRVKALADAAREGGPQVLSRARAHGENRSMAYIDAESARRPQGARDPHQPRGEGRQGRPPLQLQRARRRRRRTATSASASARPTRCPRRSARATSRRARTCSRSRSSAARSRTR